MKQLTPEQKHSILLEYSPHSHTHSFSPLSLRHGVMGGGEVIRRWYKRWNHTIASLQPRKKSGRPRILSKEQVVQHILTPIRLANRSHRSIHYTQLIDNVRESTGTNVSIQTMRRYGKKEGGGRMKRGTKRTVDECKYIHVSLTFLCIVCVFYQLMSVYV